MIDIKGLDKAEVLKALYDHSKVQGMGFLSAVDSFSLEDAQDALEETPYFDYLYGKVMKVDLSGDSFDEYLYDRDNGEGAAQKAIDNIKQNEKEYYTEK